MHYRSFDPFGPRICCIACHATFLAARQNQHACPARTAVRPPTQATQTGRDLCLVDGIPIIVGD